MAGVLSMARFAAVTTTFELFQSKLKRVPLSNQPCRKVSRNSSRSAQRSSMDNAFKVLCVMIVLIMIDDQRLIVIQIVRRIRLFNSAFSVLHDVRKFGRR